MTWTSSKCRGDAPVSTGGCKDRAPLHWYARAGIRCARRLPTGSAPSSWTRRDRGLPIIAKRRARPGDIKVTVVGVPDRFRHGGRVFRGRRPPASTSTHVVQNASPPWNRTTCFAAAQGSQTTSRHSRRSNHGDQIHSPGFGDQVSKTTSQGRMRCFLRVDGSRSTGGTRRRRDNVGDLDLESGSHHHARAMAEPCVTALSAFGRTDSRLR